MGPYNQKGRRGYRNSYPTATRTRGISY